VIFHVIDGVIYPEIFPWYFTPTFNTPIQTEYTCRNIFW